MTLLPDIERFIERTFAASERLRAEIEHLKIDYRDVILAAEYAKKAGEWVRIRDLDRPIGDVG